MSAAKMPSPRDEATPKALSEAEFERLASTTSIEYEISADAGDCYVDDVNKVKAIIAEARRAREEVASNRSAMLKLDDEYNRLRKEFADAKGIAQANITRAETAEARVKKAEEERDEAVRTASKLLGIPLCDGCLMGEAGKHLHLSDEDNE